MFDLATHQILALVVAGAALVTAIIARPWRDKSRDEPCMIDNVSLIQAIKKGGRDETGQDQ